MTLYTNPSAQDKLSLAVTLLALFLHPLHLHRKRGKEWHKRGRKSCCATQTEYQRRTKKDKVSDRGLAFSLGSVGAVTVEMKCVIPEQGMNELHACERAADTGPMHIQSPPVFLSRMCARGKRSPKGKGGERKSTTLMHRFTSFLGFCV